MRSKAFCSLLQTLLSRKWTAGFQHRLLDTNALTSYSKAFHSLVDLSLSKSGAVDSVSKEEAAGYYTDVLEFLKFRAKVSGAGVKVRAQVGQGSRIRHKVSWRVPLLLGQEQISRASVSWVGAMAEGQSQSGERVGRASKASATETRKVRCRSLDEK